MEIVSIKLDTPPSAQKIHVDPRMFGANMLFDRDFVSGFTSAGSSSRPGYNFAFANLNATAIRYPGGTLAEKYLDLRNPNSPHAEDQLNPSESNTSSKPIVTLNEVLEFSAQHAAGVTIVIPTYRFLGKDTDAQGHRYAQVDQPLINDFIRQCLSAAHNIGATIEAFEIGNEWHVDNTQSLGTRMTPIEYGRIASELATIVDETMSSFSLSETAPMAKIIVQVGPGGSAEKFTKEGHYISDGYVGETASATSLIFQEFDTFAERQAVDGLVTHRYLTGSDSRIDGWKYSPFQEFVNLAEGVGGFGDFDYHVTEWNVAARNSAELGVQQAGNMLTLFAEMLEAGVDSAAVWAVQQANRSALSTSTGLDGSAYVGLSAAGVVFSMLASNAAGLDYLPMAHAQATIETYFFQGRDASYLYVFNDSPQSSSISLSAKSLLTSSHVTSATVVSPINGSLFQSKIVPEVADLDFMSVRDEDGDILLPLDSYDVIELEILPGAAFSTSASKKWDDVTVGTLDSDIIFAGAGKSLVKGNAENDAIYGGSSRDQLWGGDGDDSILGQEGNDWIHGGSGGDYIYGGIGDDRTWGGSGNDTLYGGSGSDKIDTGRGADLAFGGSGDDEINFGRGDDTVTGGAGADTFIFTPHSGRSTITDYTREDLLYVAAPAGDRGSGSLLGTVVDDFGIRLLFGKGVELYVQGATETDLGSWSLLPSIFDIV